MADETTKENEPEAAAPSVDEAAAPSLEEASMPEAARPSQRPSTESAAIAVSQRAPPSLSSQTGTEAPEEAEMEEEPAGPPVWQRVAVWVIAVSIGSLFVLLGATKLGVPAWYTRQFVGWGYAVWFVAVIGLLELSGGLLLFVPKLRFWGAMLISIDMLGAIYTHVRHGPAALIIANIMFITFSGIAAWFSLPEFIKKRLPEAKEEAPPIF